MYDILNIFNIVCNIIFQLLIWNRSKRRKQLRQFHSVLDGVVRRIIPTDVADCDDVVEKVASAIRECTANAAAVSAEPADSKPQPV